MSVVNIFSNIVINWLFIETTIAITKTHYKVWLRQMNTNRNCMRLITLSGYSSCESRMLGQAFRSGLEQVYFSAKYDTVPILKNERKLDFLWVQEKVVAEPMSLLLSQSLSFLFLKSERFTWINNSLLTSSTSHQMNANWFLMEEDFRKDTTQGHTTLLTTSETPFPLDVHRNYDPQSI